jgi:Cof subfamily protein (haloacid dehalogenase superfamily)
LISYVSPFLKLCPKFTYDLCVLNEPYEYDASRNQLRFCLLVTMLITPPKASVPNPTGTTPLYTWFLTHENEAVREIARLIQIDIPELRPIETAREKEILQIMGYFPEEKDEEIFGKVLTHCEPMRWHPLFADIIARGNSKSHGIDQMLAYYGIDLKDTMAFGDGGNDIPMLKHVGMGIAMGNAAPHIQAAADYITTSVDEEGIMQALKHFHIL